MPYTVTRQLQFPDGHHVVEVSAGGQDYTNPDQLGVKYPRLGEGDTFISPVEAANAAIAICKAWRRDGQRDAKVGYGATGGSTMPFDPTTFRDLRAWATDRLATMEKCNQCGEPLPEKRSRYRLVDEDDEEYCSEHCADLAHEQIQQMRAEVEAEREEAA